MKSKKGKRQGGKWKGEMGENEGNDDVGRASDRFHPREGRKRNNSRLSVFGSIDRKKIS